MSPRNSEPLASFVAYCEANPDCRFWQALSNWSGKNFIIAARRAMRDDDSNELWIEGGEDTFYWETRER